MISLSNLNLEGGFNIYLDPDECPYGVDPQQDYNVFGAFDVVDQPVKTQEIALKTKDHPRKKKQSNSSWRRNRPAKSGARAKTKTSQNASLYSYNMNTGIGHQY